MRTLVKLGGNAAADPAILGGLASFLADAAQRGESVVVTHGCGPQLSARLTALGIDPAFHEGLRVTGPVELQSLVQVLCREVNPSLVSTLTDLGLPAFGAADPHAGLFRASPLDPTHLGHVGRVDRVDASVVELLLAHGRIPVVAPIATDDEGSLLNINADEGTLALARALRVDRVLFISDVPGVAVDGEVVSQLTGEEAADLTDRGIIHSGMRVKVQKALDVAGHGIEAVIGSIGALVGDAPGTRFPACAVARAS